MNKRMVIVGAGIAGLSTGCYARMNGYETTIFEMHKVPGGLCTAWKRKGYTFDISMHMLTGSRSGPVRRMWEELGVVKDQEFFYHDEMVRVEGEGKSLSMCTDPRRLEEQMLATNTGKSSHAIVPATKPRRSASPISPSPSWTSVGRASRLRSRWWMYPRPLPTSATQATGKGRPTAGTSPRRA